METQNTTLTLYHLTPNQVAIRLWENGNEGLNIKLGAGGEEVAIRLWENGNCPHYSLLF